jgi:hypothetical protein
MNTSTFRPIVYSFVRANPGDIATPPFSCDLDIAIVLSYAVKGDID